MNISLRYFACIVLMQMSVNLSAQSPQSLTARKVSPPIRSDRTPVEVLATEKEKMEVAEAIDNVEFDFDEATISSGFYTKLDGLAAWMKDKDVTLRVSGFADVVGSNGYNNALSVKRALAVKAYLVGRGADPKLIDPVGFGESNPVASNDSVTGRQKNRRVEFALY